MLHRIRLGPPIDDEFKSDAFHPIDPSFYTFSLRFLLYILLCEVAPDPYYVHTYFTDVCPFRYFNLVARLHEDALLVLSHHVHLVREHFRRQQSCFGGCRATPYAASTLALSGERTQWEVSISCLDLEK
jgi:hypothetical protein